MNIEDSQKNALLALADWSKWLVAIQTGALVAITWLLRLNPPSGCTQKILVGTGFTSSMLSVVCTLSLVGVVPITLQRLPINHSIYDFIPFGKLRVAHMAGAQHALMAFGLILIGIYGLVRL